MARTKSTTASVPEASAPPSASTPEEGITLTGRLCADPVLRHTASGKPVSTIRIAVNPPEGDATFHNIVVWGRTADTVCQYKRKGHLVEVTGRAQSRDWTAQDGAARHSDEIVAHRVQFLNGRANAHVAKSDVEAATAEAVQS